MIKQISSLYQLSPAASISAFGSGLIHSTWKISDPPRVYILQKINHQVFKEPQLITDNIDAIAAFLEEKHPEYFFVTPAKTIDGQSMLHIPGEGYYRVFPFVPDSHTY